MSTLTREQVLALAPDPASAKAGQALARLSLWLSCGRSAGAVWGECQGSGKTPYRTQVDLNGPAFRCSCPSRKFPCKHGLGLLLLLAAQPEALALGEPPAWVSEWLASRAAAATRRQESAATPAPKAVATSARSLAAREARVATGMADLQRWLEDRMRAGLADFQAEAPAACNAFAARMVDAQAPGVARLLRNAGALAGSGPGWQGRMLDQLARLHLLARAYDGLAELPPELQAELRATIGFTLSQEALLAEPGLHDHWAILGRQIEEEDRLHVQRTWLWGMTSGRPALILDFSAGGQPLDHSLTPGSSFEAELVFFPGAAPLRALLKARHRSSTGFPALPASQLDLALGGYAAALAGNPWLERYPLLAGPCRLGYSDERWYVHDEDGHTMALTPHFADGWRLLDLSAGQPFTLAGIWDGTWLEPLCAQVGERIMVV
jgi:hypothetical protein